VWTSNAGHLLHALISKSRDKADNATLQMGDAGLLRDRLTCRQARFVTEHSIARTSGPVATPQTRNLSTLFISTNCLSRKSKGKRPFRIQLQGACYVYVHVCWKFGHSKVHRENERMSKRRQSYSNSPRVPSMNSCSDISKE
jgi:hypothetical protein